MAPYDHRDVAATAGDRVDQRRPARGAVKDRRRDGERPEAGVTAHPRPERGLRGPRGPERRLEERLLPAIARPVAARRDPDPAQVARRPERTAAPARAIASAPATVGALSVSDSPRAATAMAVVAAIVFMTVFGKSSAERPPGPRHR